MMPVHRAIPFELFRGGTSKGVFLKREDVPQDRSQLTACLLDIFGSPDPRQIDGLGGADKLTSKAAILGQSARDDADIDYLFAQVGIRHAEVDYNLNCGNLSAAVAAYAVEHGFVRPVEGGTAVRIHNVNTQRIIHAVVPVSGGRVVYEGGLTVDGVPGTGAPFGLDFREAIGSLTGALLPFGESATHLDVPGLGKIDVSVVDGANLIVLVAADDLGMSGIEGPAQMDGDTRLVRHMQAIREQVALRLGMGEYWRSRAAPSSPMLVAVQSPRTYQALNGHDCVDAQSLDLVCRQYSTGATSKALAATVTATIGMACRLPGSVPSRFLRSARSDTDPLRLGHPAGCIQVWAQARQLAEGGMDVIQARIERTARLIARGEVFPRR